MDPTLEHLNLLSREEGRRELLKCCGSVKWAERLLDERPFVSLDELLDKADKIWWSLEPADWLEAFRSHPKIGESKAAGPQAEQAREWSKQEQAGTANTALETRQRLAEGNRQYEEKFGHIFIVCATGRTAAEMLAILCERLTNDPENELRLAAEEQRQITQLRLRKLIASPGS